MVNLETIFETVEKSIDGIPYRYTQEYLVKRDETGNIKIKIYLASQEAYLEPDPNTFVNIYNIKSS